MPQTEVTDQPPAKKKLSQEQRERMRHPDSPVKDQRDEAQSEEKLSDQENRLPHPLHHQEKNCIDQLKNGLSILKNSEYSKKKFIHVNPKQMFE